jgi:hypothetical protein
MWCAVTGTGPCHKVDSTETAIVKASQPMVLFSHGTLMNLQIMGPRLKLLAVFAPVEIPTEN